MNSDVKAEEANCQSVVMTLAISMDVGEEGSRDEVNFEEVSEAVFVVDITVVVVVGRTTFSLQRLN